MPWTGSSFKSKHNKKLSDVMAEHAASMANAVLRKTGDEGLAIRVANVRARGTLAGVLKRAKR